MRAGPTGGRPVEKSAEHALKDRLNVLYVMLHVEQLRQLRLAQVLPDFTVCFEQGREIALFLPRKHGIALDEPISVLAREPLLGEREHHALGVHQTAKAIEVLLHARGIDDELVDDVAEPRERKIKR